MGRPYVHINCASTIDGKIAFPDGSRMRISGPWDMERVQFLRTRLGAIMVGAGTIMSDDPGLTVKDSYVKDPPSLTKVVIDGRGRISAGARFLRTPGRSIIVTSMSCSGEWLSKMEREKDNAGLELELLRIKGDGPWIDLGEALEDLHDLGIESILVEGGSRTIWELVEKGLYDRFTIYYAPVLLGGSGPTIMGGTGFTSPLPGVRIAGSEITPEGGLFIEVVPEEPQ